MQKSSAIPDACHSTDRDPDEGAIMRFRCLSIPLCARAGEVAMLRSHECVDIAFNYSISDQYITRLLKQVATFRS